MNEKLEDKKIFKSIDKTLNILENNFRYSYGKKIPFDEIFEMVNDLYVLLNNYEHNTKKCGEIAVKRYIPLLDLLIKVDNNNSRYNTYYKILKYAYKLGARVSLEHYMVYREWEDDDKFFEPRYRMLQGYIHYLDEITTNPNFELLIANMPSGYGKLLANNTPILTRKGWKNHGDLVVGDEILSPNGDFIKVTMVHPKRFANTKVTFEDGEEIICHNQHEWQVYDREARKEKQVETTYIMQHCHCKGGRNRFYLPLIKPIKGEYKDLPVDPYTYGVWLGDGSTNQGKITQNNNDKIIFEYIQYNISRQFNGASENVKTYQIQGLADDLHKLGLCYQKHTEEKYIHDSYLTADISQRLELLAGLIDTDGYLDRIKQRYIIVTCGEKLRDSIISLISTFNWRVSITTVPPTTSTSGIVGKKNTYYIGFSPTMKVPCKLKRKQINRLHKQRRIGISNVEFVPVQEGNCITVEGGLYLAGKTLKITHNTYPEKISEAWSFGIDDKGAILSLCSNDNVVKGGSRTVINEIKSEVFGEVFPHLAYDPKDRDFFLKETDGEWKLKNCKLMASYNATTTSSNVVGQRASKRIHIDDLYPDYKEAMNKNTNDTFYNDYHTVWKKRFVQEAKKHKIVVTGTLWSSDDFIARLIAHTKSLHKFIKHPKYPYTLISEDGSVAIIQVPALDYETGESVCPELRSTQKVLEDKEAIEDYLFQTNFQQIPTDPESLFFSYHRLRTYETIPQTDYSGSYAVIDATRKTGKDFFAMPIFKKVPNENNFDYYLKDCIFSREATKDMYDVIVEKVIENHIIHLVIESNVTSELLKAINERLRNAGINYCEIFEKYNTIPKQTRIENEKGIIKRQLVFPKKGMYGINTEIGKFMENLTIYNNSGTNANDDAPDSCAMFCSEIIEENSQVQKAEAVPDIRRFF